MTQPCGRCGAENEIVNACGCDPANLPTQATQCRACYASFDEPTADEGNGLCWGCFKEHAKIMVDGAAENLKGKIMRQVGIWVTFGEQGKGKVELRDNEVEVETPQGDLYLKREDAMDLAAALQELEVRAAREGI